MATIKAIEGRTVHQIQSGQVIVDLCSVVKELVENSLDAGAKSVDVRFKNQGLDSIEVQDNGSGISKENYESLALKHYTSKLATYDDLSTLETFGFRGEALSSLCALSTFSVTTCVAGDAPRGTKLEYETSGKLRTTSVVAAQRGTTVSVEGLFRNLPVRRRELERNIKREWNKVIGVLNQYACIQTDVKFSVSQQPTKGKRIVLFSTKGNPTTRENIANVFGAKTLTVLIPLELKLELEPTAVPAHQRIVQHDDSTKEILVKGHVSRPAHGEGRQTPDRQMFFVNARPCGLPQFAKVFNEVYKSYNTSQSPFIFADIQLDTHLYDVNVSPDKRTILLHDQSRMLENLRESLVALFEAQDYAVPTSQLSLPKHTSYRQLSLGKPDASRAGSEKQGPAPISGQKSQHLDNGQAAQSNDDGRPLNATIMQSGSGGNDQTQSLMSRWAERRSTARRSSSSSDEQAASKAQKEFTKPRNEVPIGIDQGQHGDEDDDSLEADVIPVEPPSSSPMREQPEPAQQVKDFNEHMELLNRPNAERPKPKDAQESPIPAVVLPSRVPETWAGRSSPSRSLKRAAPEVATITIGEATTTSTIGSSAKRTKAVSPQPRPSSVRNQAKSSVPVPSFKGRLSQMFSAQSNKAAGQQSSLGVSSETIEKSDESDSASENLFVSDNEEDEEMNEPMREDEPQELEEEADPSGDDEDGDQASDADAPSPTREHEDDSERQEALSEDAQSAKDAPGDPDDDYIDEIEARALADADAKARANVAVADDTSGEPSEETQKRSQTFVKGGTKKKDATYQLEQTLRTSEQSLRELLDASADWQGAFLPSSESSPTVNRLDADDAEDKLSLTISKSDFGRMKIIGQFNLGFILATRPGQQPSHKDDGKSNLGGRVHDETSEEMFIIDQHATDEKYNFERLQASTVVQSQRLVQPKALELTALEEEVVKENLGVLETNGFAVQVDESGDYPVGQRCQLLSLPLSRETTFSLADLEELISLLTDHPHQPPADSASLSSSLASVPRPSKVRKMFAMRACRSSVMIGRSLTGRQMQRLVRHMGELDKPWNCPHGRPTMRHLCSLDAWAGMAWREGEGEGEGEGDRTDWAAYLASG